MNDDELVTLVREQRAKVLMTSPVEEIVCRGRAVRARRRILRLAGALAVAAGAAVAVTVLAPGQGTARPGARLAAWTVTKQADGDIFVTVRELTDPAGLQATLRADGIAARVDFVPSLRVRRQPVHPSQQVTGEPAGSQRVTGLPAGCQVYPWFKWFKSPPAVIGPPFSTSSSTDAIFVIHAAAIPGGAGVAIEVGRETAFGAGRQRVSALAAVTGLVRASQSCTGS
jgi:hypothetical protein